MRKATTTHVRGRPFSEAEDKLLKTYFVDELRSVAWIGKTMQRADRLVRARIADLKLQRSETEFALRSDARREAAKARMAGIKPARADLVEGRHEAHVEACLTLSGGKPGFPALRERHRGGGQYAVMPVMFWPAEPEFPGPDRRAA